MKLQSGLRTEESRRKWDKIFGKQEEESEVREALDLSMKAAEKMTEPYRSVGNTERIVLFWK